MNNWKPYSLNELSEYGLMKAIARSEGLNESDGKLKRYLPVFHHPLPISDYRHQHEEIYRRVVSCRKEKQALAAISYGDAWTLEEVYMRGAPVDLLDNLGNSCLHLAVQMGNVDCVMVLINIGIELSTVNKLGFTPLFLAHSKGLQTIQNLLRDHGAKMYVNRVGESPSSTILEVAPERKIPRNDQLKLRNVY